MKNRFLITIGILLFGVSLTKAGVREDLEAANRIPDEQWLEKAKAFISVFDDLREALVKKWKEVGGDLLGTSPFNLYAWKNNQFVNSSYGSGYIDEEEHEVCSCGLHLLRGICCYPCVQCFEDTGLEEEDCFDAWMDGTPFWCCIGPFEACCDKDIHPITKDYFTLNIYKPICEDWLLP